MSNAGKLIKSLAKTKKESVMGKLGDAPYEDPMEPWSAKYNAPVKEEIEQLDEDSWLFSYIKSLGYNPKIMTFAQRSKYARSNAFKHYKQAHMTKSAPVAQPQYEETEQIDEISKELSNRYMHSAFADRKKTDDKIADLTSKQYTQDKFWSKHKRIGKLLDKSNRRTTGISRALNRITKEELEPLDEAGTGLLMTFIKGKGLNPLTMDGNQKHAYARSSEFKVFKQKHGNTRKEETEIQETSGMGERGDDWNEETGATLKEKPKKKIKEETDKTDMVTMDIPLLIRVLEYAREDAKTDMDLHKVVENLINMRGEGCLSMEQYDKIVAIKESIEESDEAKYDKKYQDMVKRVGQKAAKKPVDIKALAARLKSQKPLKELKKMPDNMDADDHITRESVQVHEGIGGIEDSPMSATNSVKAMESAHRSKQMKSARMIKSLYKNKMKKENLYDWEKDDKPNAKIIMKGGTTMTGQPRDTVEIEPVLKTRPNSAKP